MLFQQELAGCLTEQEYERSIPDACSMPMQVHLQGMLCWGLVRAIERGHRQNCDGCDENKVNHQARLERFEQRKKEREKA
jgi:hypothetical protein